MPISRNGMSVLGGSLPEHPATASELPGLLPEGASICVYHEPTTGMAYVVVRDSRFDVTPRTIPLPAHFVTVLYARTLNDAIDRMGGAVPVPGLTPVCEMMIGSQHKPN